MTTARDWNFAVPSRSTRNTCSRSRTTSPTRAIRPVTLYPYALISRHGTPPTLGYYILHEGLIGVLGDRLQEDSYADLEKKKDIPFTSTNAWLGIHRQILGGDAAARCRRQRLRRSSPLTRTASSGYQTDYNLDPQTLAPGATGSAETRLFAGAKEVSIVDGYNTRARSQQVRPADRLGLVLLHHQADVLCDRLDLSPASAISASPS